MTKIQIKYCGLRTTADILAAAEAGATAVGFVFVKKSPRYISTTAAIPLACLAKKHKLITVALFADQDALLIKQVINAVNPDVLQFHGNEDAVFCEQFSRPYWKAIPMLTDIDYLQYIKQHPKAEAYLLDAFGKQQSGGSGKTFNWFEFPSNLRNKLILAGGINAENVVAAVAATKAQFIDTSSGIESKPGVKSKLKMLALADNINQPINTHKL
ncbi:MAG: phosphoribosylanthranilate isomerase [Marinicella sp.]